MRREHLFRTRDIACPVLFALILAGCGYPGDPLPPALNRPVPVADLTTVEHGQKIDIHFTVPKITTEGLPVPGKPDIELRIGPAPGDHFDLPAWEGSSERVPNEAIQVTGGGATAELDASKLYGKTVWIAVRVHGPGGSSAGWSRFEVLQVVPALQRPEGLKAEDAPDAVRLDWHATAPSFRIFRAAAGGPEWNEIGTSDKPVYSDAGIEYGKGYQYYVQSIEKTGDKYAESEPSATIVFKPMDRFAPAVPGGLTAVPGTRTIELVWDRNTEKDFAFYRIFRDGQKISDGSTAPSFSDRDVKAGVKYRYQIGAVDLAGNESPLSAGVESIIP